MNSTRLTKKLVAAWLQEVQIWGQKCSFGSTAIPSALFLFLNLGRQSIQVLNHLQEIPAKYWVLNSQCKNNKE